MKRDGKPKMFLMVWGDWQSIISARDYFEQLIDQKPNDAEMGECFNYRIPCATTAELFTAYQRFLPLARTLAVVLQYTSDDKAVKVFASSDDGWGKSFCTVEASDDDVSSKATIRRAIDILEQA